MLKNIFFILLFLILYAFPENAYALGSSYISVVNPVRGADFWDLPDQNPYTAVFGQMQIIKEFNIPATWLIRFDALSDNQIITILKNSSPTQEKGLFLEITPSWTKMAGVNYNQQSVWHNAGSAFLTGYGREEREKLIDAAFVKFKEVFGGFPSSVGAWWIDSYSLSYMQKKYNIVSALIVADQYTTDNYQIWGQYWSAPYYPNRQNALIPAQNEADKIPVTIMQWAARDPVNAYGDGVQESTYSVQANDYLDYHSLKTDYFGKLVDIFTEQQFNAVNHIVVGLENSYLWSSYQEEYKNQLMLLSQKEKAGQFSLISMGDFGRWYKREFPTISPEQIIEANDSLGTHKKAIWYMNPYYRVGWFLGSEGSIFRDVRQYISGTEEPCWRYACNELNFATFSARVLDDVTYKERQVLDVGEISNFKIEKKAGKYILSYENETGNRRIVEFFPRDISIDGKVSSIDTFILNAQNSQANQEIINLSGDVPENLKELLPNIFFKLFKFLLFLALAIFIPGYLFVRYLKQKSLGLNIFLSVCAGFVMLTLISYLGGYLKLDFLIWIYGGVGMLVFTMKGYYKELVFKKMRELLTPALLPYVLIVLTGTIFQSLLVARSGWVYDFGVGFWGPTGHDGIWHQALIAQLIKGVPPENPGFAGVALSNYHYFFDLLTAATYKLTQIPVADLLYRFYPLSFSILLGLGTYFLVNMFTKNRRGVLLSLYFVYFAGSFGWIVDLIKKQAIGGESAFWANQPVSINLNPPFAISLLIIIAVILLYKYFEENKNYWVMSLFIILAGSLIEFKVYAGIILLGGLFLHSVQKIILERNFLPLKLFLGSSVLSAAVFLPQNSQSGNLLAFSPFWFIHSMIDFPDRVGWERLSIARPAYITRGEWWKFFLIEGVGFLVFILGNLGTRFVGLWKMRNDSLILWMSVISLIMPVLFIQKGTNWNTIQFFYYFIYFAAIFSGLVWVSIYQKIPKIIGFILISFILLITPISSVATFRNAFYPNPPAMLSGGELEALNFLQSKSDGVVLTYPFDKNLRSRFSDPYSLAVYDTSAYVSAFTGKATYIEDEVQQEIFQNDYRKRLVEVKEFFGGRNSAWNREFLRVNRIHYIYVPKFFNVGVFNEIFIKKIFENREVDIFEVQI
ncbi:MAG: hypothetical protein US31_C0004G0051 [Berkelbacteria bacterium GW2011_GWA1_36_9]|uniref:Uncharacterized protein n=1 Tax=Berkelbacteria bacterium GW2011_GWA1_36_9 TaxID=1618331 RepID=A0A0G0I2H9_9BACT|nr:MAG: hypothetical protein US31_C0004G0051 [Berkelbacteria bacterium GW2011_GWA1_36_9]